MILRPWMFISIANDVSVVLFFFSDRMNHIADKTTWDDLWYTFHLEGGTH